MKSKIIEADIQELFEGLTSNLFAHESEWFESEQVHSLFTPAVTVWLMALKAKYNLLVIRVFRVFRVTFCPKDRT